VVEPSHLKKYAQVKLDLFARDRDENKKSLQPPPSYYGDGIDTMNPNRSGGVWILGDLL